MESSVYRSDRKFVSGAPDSRVLWLWERGALSWVLVGATERGRGVAQELLDPAILLAPQDEGYEFRPIEQGGEIYTPLHHPTWSARGANNEIAGGSGTPSSTRGGSHAHQSTETSIGASDATQAATQVGVGDGSLRARLANTVPILAIFECWRTLNLNESGAGHWVYGGGWATHNGFAWDALPAIPRTPSPDLQVVE